MTNQKDNRLNRQIQNQMKYIYKCFIKIEQEKRKKNCRLEASKKKSRTERKKRKEKGENKQKSRLSLVEQK